MGARRERFVRAAYLGVALVVCILLVASFTVHKQQSSGIVSPRGGGRSGEHAKARRHHNPRVPLKRDDFPAKDPDHSGHDRLDRGFVEEKVDSAPSGLKPSHLAPNRTQPAPSGAVRCRVMGYSINAPDMYPELEKMHAQFRHHRFPLMHYFRMCEAARGGPVDGRHLVCDEDVTCMKCIEKVAPYKLDAAERMVRAYNNATAKQLRAAFFQAAFPNPAEQAVIVIAANFKAMHLMLNWACGAEKLGVTDLKQTVMILATDEGAYEQATALGFHALHPRMLDWASYEVANVTKQEMLGGFNLAMASLWIVLAEMLQAGYTVIAQDADIVWLKDPRPDFAFSHVDMRSEMAPQTGVRGPANTGFLIIQPNMKTYTFAHSMVHLIPIMFWRACDQLAFNSIIRNHKFRQLHYETLPRRQFLDLHVQPNGEGTAKMISDDTFVLHAIASRKEQKFRDVQQWHFDQTCETYFAPAVFESMPSWAVSRRELARGRRLTAMQSVDGGQVAPAA